MSKDKVDAEGGELPELESVGEGELVKGREDTPGDFVASAKLAWKVGVLVFSKFELIHRKNLPSVRFPLIVRPSMY